ncbi:putative ectomycorrhiza-upregulated zf-mynd domain-containing protein [Hirsutella rhossiliensis]
MPPIDYSKWDNIDTDSEPETSPQQAPAAKPPAAHACLAADGYVRFEETHSKSGHVEAVIVRCEAEKRKFPLWSATTIPANHDMFSQSVPSVPALIEVPLVLYRTGTQSVNEADLDNQIATYLNIDADSGRPFYPQHLEGVWMFCDHILDLFGEGDGPPRWLYSRQAFEKWWVNYCEEQKRLRPGKGGERDPDDWRAARSPYQV